MTTRITDERHRRVREYYEDSWLDYRMLWMSKATRGMHFGYEQPGSRSHDESLLAINHVMAETAGLLPGERVLDAGCGVGGSAMWLADTLGCRVTGISIVEDQVERAKRYARQRNLMRMLDFLVADFCESGLPTESFDAVWAQESACHADLKPPLVAEWHRLLVPGGRIVVAEFIANRRDAPVERWSECWEMTLATEEEWRDALNGAGLVDVRFHDITSRVRRSVRRLYRLCRALRPAADALHRLDRRTHAQQRNLAGGIAGWEALVAGSWRYCLITASRPGGTGSAADVPTS